MDVPTSPANGTQPIAVTVPPVANPGFSLPSCKPLNQQIKEYCMQHNIPCADLFAATSDPKTGLMKREYAMDVVHFNIKGYKLMAKIIFEQGVKPFLQTYKPK